MTIKATLPTGDEITSLPFEAPWLTPYGMGLINITALRQNSDGTIEAQLVNENAEPYIRNGSDVWCDIKNFPSEWPQ